MDLALCRLHATIILSASFGPVTIISEYRLYASTGFQDHRAVVERGVSGISDFLLITNEWGTLVSCTAHFSTTCMI